MSVANLLTKRRGLGWRANPPDSRDWGIERLGLRADDLAEEVDLTPHVGGVRNQRSTSSCVGQALAGAVDIREVWSGFPYDPASALFPYYHARRMVSAAVVDRGSHIRFAVKAMAKLGIPDERYWRFGTSPLRVNRRPGWEAHMMAHPRRGGAYYAIEGYGADRVGSVRCALAAGHPVIFGTPVTKAFTRDQGPGIVDRPAIGDPMAGGHAMVLVGYIAHPQEGLLFRCLNSWGDDWRQGGLCWLTESYVRWQRAHDFTIVVGWERIKGQR